MKFRCDVMEPPKTYGTVGERIGNSTVYLRGLPCSIDDVTGDERKVANQTTGVKTFIAKLYGDPRKPITNRHWLKWGKRILQISDAKDTQQNGTEYELICGETQDQ